jgi:hypothetical protein
MIGGKIVQWLMRFILIGLYLIFGFLIISAAFNRKLEVHDATFQQVFAAVTADAIKQGVVNENIFDKDYYADMFGDEKRVGFKLELYVNGEKDVVKETYYNKEFYGSRHNQQGRQKSSKYASYDGTMPVNYDGKAAELKYSMVVAI